jgi:hypothetical protein
METMKQLTLNDFFYKVVHASLEALDLFPVLLVPGRDGMKYEAIFT